MAEIKVADNGSLVVTGATLLDGEGNPIQTKEKFYLCRCGKSNKKPFCDGAHKKGFESKVRAGQ